MNELDLLLLRAESRVEQEAARALRDGVPLSPEEIAVARRCGVQSPERVRLLRVASMPQPDNSMLQAMAQRFNFSLGDAHGLTLNFGIFILEAAWRNHELIAHELVHVAQYERLGTESFLRQYLGEVLSVGYHLAPMEREAFEVSRAALV